MHSVRVLRNTDADLDLQVVGKVGGLNRTPLYLPDASHATVKVLSIVYAIEAGVQVSLRWEREEGKDVLLVPLEGRGFLDFSRIGGLQHPEHATGRILLDTNSSSGEFFLGLELIKQRSL